MGKSILNYNDKSWSEHFILNSESPSGLSWLKTGKPAGWKQYQQKYKTPACYSVGFLGGSFVVHRIIWVMLHGSIENQLVIDHKDGNPFNNAICNLELKTWKGNTQNKKMRVNNKTGITGVYKTITHAGCEYVVARWSNEDGSDGKKYFSIKKYGEDQAVLLAKKYRDLKISELIDAGQGYTHRHTGANSE